MVLLSIPVTGPALSTAQFRSSPSSLYFPGTGYVLMEDPPFSCQDFVYMEFWVYCTNLAGTSGQRVTLLSSRVGTNFFRLSVVKNGNAAGTPISVQVGSGGASFTFTTEHSWISNNTWHHIAFRYGYNKLDLWSNGTLLSTNNTGVLTTGFYNAMTRVVFGGEWNGTTIINPFQGYIDNYMVTSNGFSASRSHGNFTVYATPHSDRPDIIYRNNFGGTNGSTDIPLGETVTAVDTSGITLVGSSASVVYSSTVSKSGPTSLYIPNRTNHVIMSNIPSACYGSSFYWTIQFWFYLNSETANGIQQTILASHPNRFYLTLEIHRTSNQNQLRFGIGTNGTSYNIELMSPAGTLSRQTWHHITISSFNENTSGDPTLQLLVNGVRRISTVVTTTYANNLPGLLWGARTTNSADSGYLGLDGYIDGLRISPKCLGARAYSDTNVTPYSPYTPYMHAAYVNEFTGTNGQSLTVPSTPTGVTATWTSGTAVTVSWSAVSGADTYNVQWWTGSPLSQSGSTTGIATTSTSITGLTSGTSYEFRVFAVNTSGTSASYGSTTSTAPTRPPAPSSVSGSWTSGTAIDLSWGSVSGATSYSIQTYTAGSLFSTDTSNTNSFSKTGLTSGTSYEFRVFAVNVMGTSNSYGSLSTTSPSLPSAASNVTVTWTSGTAATVSWSAGSGAQTYTVQWWTGSPLSQTGSSSGVAPTSVNVTGLTSGTSYEFRVYSVNVAGTSSSYASTTSTAPTLPSAPSSVTVTWSSGTATTVEWASVSGALSYEVQWYLASGGSVLGTNLELATSSTLTSLTSGTSYEFRVYTRNVVGLSSTYASTTATAPSRPASPTNLAVEWTSGTSASLSWTASGTATSYRIEWRLGSNGTLVSSKSNVATTSDVLTGLTSGTTYEFRVYAVNVAGESTSFSSFDSTAPVRPLAPTNPTGGWKTSSSIDVEWSPSVGATSYTVQWWSNGTQTGSATGITGTERVVTGLSDSLAYEIRIYAVNVAGTSLAYALFTVTAPTVPPAPSLLTVTWTLTTSASLSWSYVGAASSYTVQWWSGSPLSQIGSQTNVSSSPVTITDLEPGATYDFRVYAVNFLGPSGSYASRTSTSPTRPLAPSSLSLSWLDGISARLTWSVVSTAVSYELELWSGGNLLNTYLILGDLTYTLTALSEGTTYEARVYARNVAGASLSYTSVTSTAPVRPLAPGSVSATWIDHVTAVLTWASAERATSYKVEWWTGGSRAGFRESLPTPGVTLEALLSGTTYEFRVYAVNVAGPSLAYGSVTTTSPVDPSNPNELRPPSMLSAAWLTASSVRLLWPAAPSAAAYEVVWFRGANVALTHTMQGISGTTVDVADESLDDEYIYTFRIWSRSGSGELSKAFTPVTLLSRTTSPSQILQDLQTNFQPMIGTSRQTARETMWTLTASSKALDEQVNSETVTTWLDNLDTVQDTLRTDALCFSIYRQRQEELLALTTNP